MMGRMVITPAQHRPNQERNGKFRFLQQAPSDDDKIAALDAENFSLD